MKLGRMIVWSSFALLLLALAGCRGKGKFEDQPLGYVGEARRDPFLALGKLLESWGDEPHEYVPSLDMEAYDYGTVIVRRETLDDAVQVEAVRELMRNEAHVIVLMDAGDVFINDWTQPSWGTPIFEMDGFDDTPLAELFEEAGFMVDVVGGTSGNSEARKIRFLGQEYEVDMPISWNLGYSAEGGDVEPLDKEQGQQGSLPLVSAEYESGRLTVVDSAKPFRNRFIAEHDHAALYHALWDASGYYGTAVVKGKGISFFALVWERAWMVVVAVGTWLVLWLWVMLKRRAAPVEPLPPALTSYRERIENTASFIWERGAADSLVASIKRAVADRWRIITGESIEYPAMPDPEMVAARLGGTVSAEKISAAFAFAKFDDVQGLQQTIEVLQTIHREL
jgi:hypothetical protein